MIIHDSHIHIGQFRGLYSTPADVFNFLTLSGVEKFAVSSTSTIDSDCDFILKEMKEIIKIGGDRIVPVLWINPEWVSDGSISKLLQSGIKWKCLKIHGFFSHWEDIPEVLQDVIELAEKMKLPLLLHTGGREASDAGSYLDIIKNNPKVNFILAHSRPVDQAIQVMKTCPNAWADTAFTPIEDIKEMVMQGLSCRLLWGTDYPLHNVYYTGQDIKKMIYDKLEALRGFTTPAQFDKITFKNFEMIFAVFD